MINLRCYQTVFINAIWHAWLTLRSILAVMPTGGGKTVCFASVMHNHTGASAAIVHRKEIVTQISCALATLEVKHRIIAPPQVVSMIRRKHLKLFRKSYVDPHASAGVISVQTLTSKASAKNKLLQRWLNQISLAVFDEGHHYIDTGQWGRAVEMMSNAKLLFVTATPDRADCKGLGKDANGFAQILIEGPTTRWLIENGYLSRFIYKAPATDLNTDNIPITASGDFNMRVFRERVVESHLVGDVVKHYSKFALGKQCIVFASDVATAEEIAAEFNSLNINANALSGETDDGTRDRELEKFESRQIQVLVNVDLFDEGFDVAGVEAVIMARKTESLAKFLQMIGRALRVIYAQGFDLSTKEGRLAAIAAGSKADGAIIIDPVRNWERHGMPDWPRKWSLNGREKGTRKTDDDTVPQRVCNNCTQPYEAFYKYCPYCGTPHIPAARATPAQVEGDLIELDVESMAALFAQIQAANMSEENYAQNQIDRQIPSIGRSADMRRFRDAKYRRQVLDTMVRWWVGLQTPKRGINEIYMRFYHRFGVDMGTAYTLNAKDTDALIERMRKEFSEDIAA